MFDTKGQVLLLAAMLIFLLMITSILSLVPFRIIRTRQRHHEAFLQQVASIALEALAYGSRKYVLGDDSLTERVTEYLKVAKQRAGLSARWFPQMEILEVNSSVTNGETLRVEYMLVARVKGLEVSYTCYIRAIMRGGLMLLRCIHRGPLGTYIVGIKVVKGGFLLCRDSQDNYLVLPYSEELLIMDMRGVWYRLRVG